MATAKFGQRKFGTFKFGHVDLSSPRYSLEVDWNSDGIFDGSSEGSRLNDLSIERGRQHTISADGSSFEDEETGRVSATLIDEDRRYDPYNTNSPLFGMLTGGKLFRIRTRLPSDEVKDLMAGVLSEPVSFTDRGMTMATLQGSDGWGFLRDQKNMVTIPLQENIYVDEAMQLILDGAGWPAMWGRALDLGVDLRPYFWMDARSPARAIHELAFNELGSVNLAANGSIVFRSRNSDDAPVVTLTSDNILPNGIRRMTPSEVIRNVLKVQSTPRAEQTTQEVWRMAGTLQIDVGETIDDIWAEFKYNNETVPVKSPITPVATTDYTAFSNSDGTGTNLTANISVAMTPFSTRGKIRATNNGGTVAHINLIKVRGNPISPSNTTTFEYTDSESVRQFGPRPFTFQVDQNTNIARSYRDLLGFYLTSRRNYLVIDLVPDWDLQFAVDLGENIRVFLSGQGINQVYRLIRISHKFKDPAGIVVMTRWWLEPFTNLITGVQIPVQIPFQLGQLA